MPGHARALQPAQAVAEFLSSHPGWMRPLARLAATPTHLASTQMSGGRRDAVLVVPAGGAAFEVGHGCVSSPGHALGGGETWSSIGLIEGVRRGPGGSLRLSRLEHPDDLVADWTRPCLTWPRQK